MNNQEIPKTKTYDSPYSCNKCGNHNSITIKDQVDSIMSECETKCSICGFDDFWAYGFFESCLDGFDASKKYSFEQD